MGMSIPKPLPFRRGALAYDGDVRLGTISLNRHAGLVPASTVPHTHRPLVTRHGGPRDEPGVTQNIAAHTRFATPDSIGDCPAAYAGMTVEENRPHTGGNPANSL